MKKSFIYIVGLLLVSIFISGCETKGYFIDRNINTAKPGIVEVPISQEKLVASVDIKPLTQSTILEADALFDFNSASLKPQSRDVLDALAQQVKNSKSQIEKIEIVGHADSIGQNENYNQWLSEKRANTIANYLASKGVSCNMNIVGVGSKYAVESCLNSSDYASFVACNEINRRVEIKLINKTKLI
jgi:OOP family OmpA-OmpF porin